MSPGKLIRGCLNFALHPLHWEVVKAPKFKNARFQMADALARAGEHNIDVTTIIDVGASDGKWSRQAMLAFPDAIKTIIVSPIARPNPRIILAAIPGSAVGRTTVIDTCHGLAPRASDASRSDCGTDVMASSAMVKMMGITASPRAIPALKALSRYVNPKIF